mmetsp:Transcript_3658/g.10415  ORF Transcript_3658/g.10415 Transcript_3658/m.10415 type:complete len:486 (+) Transcript_3658:266-1723(+)
MVLSKMKAGGLPPHLAGAEHTLSAGASKQTPLTTATTGKETKKKVATPGATESRSDQSTSAPSVGASLATEGSQRSAVRITRSSGIKKSPSKAKKNKSATKNKAADDPIKSNKKLTRVGTLPPRPAKGEKAVNSKKAAKKVTPRPKPRQIAKKTTGCRDDGARDAPEKNVSEEDATGTTPPKPGGVLKGCKSDDNDRNDVMENGVKAVGASKTDGGLDYNATAGSQLWSVASGDMTHVHSYLNESYRSFEGGALKIKVDLVHDSKAGLQDIGRSASEWGETKKVELTENVIPMLFADGKMFITQALSAITAGCGTISNNMMVKPGADAKDAAVGQAGVPAEVEGSKDEAEEEEEGKHLMDNLPDDIAPQLSAITQDDLPMPEDDDGEEGVFPEKQQKESLGQEKARGVVAIVPVHKDDFAQLTEGESGSDVPFIEPISPANSMPENVETMPSEIGEEVDAVPKPEPKAARKKKTMWGRPSKKSSK